jgi:hypothetical protein
MIQSAPLYPLRFKARRSVERMVMNNNASFALGASNNRRFIDIATLHSSS